MTACTLGPIIPSSGLALVGAGAEAHGAEMDFCHLLVLLRVRGLILLDRVSVPILADPFLEVVAEGAGCLGQET